MYWKANGERDYARELAEENARIQKEHRKKIESTPVDGELWAYIFSLPIKAIGHLLALPFRYGYGKQYLWALLSLFFVAPVTFFVGAFVLGIHAHPQAFLAFWQAYVIRHPGAASWTWAIRGFTDLCRW